MVDRQHRHLRLLRLQLQVKLLLDRRKQRRLSIRVVSRRRRHLPAHPHKLRLVRRPLQSEIPPSLDPRLVQHRPVQHCRLHQVGEVCHCRVHHVQCRHRRPKEQPRHSIRISRLLLHLRPVLAHAGVCAHACPQTITPNANPATHPNSALLLTPVMRTAPIMEPLSVSRPIVCLRPFARKHTPSQSPWS